MTKKEKLKFYKEQMELSFQRLRQFETLEEPEALREFYTLKAADYKVCEILAAIYNEDLKGA